MFSDLIEAGIMLVVLVIIVFNVVLPITNTALNNQAVSNSTNLSGAASTMAQQTPLFAVLALIFVPLAVLAISAFRK